MGGSGKGPDIMQFLALYGSLRAGEAAHGRLRLGAGLRLVGPCVIPGALYDLGDYPALLAEDGEVVGDLFKVVNLAAIGELDAYEGFLPRAPGRSLYIRTAIRLIQPRTIAWVYVYNLALDRDGLDRTRRIVSGDWTKYRVMRRGP